MIDFPAWFSYGCYGGLACCVLAIVVNALYATLCKRGTTRQLIGAIISLAISALLLLLALFWYHVHFNAWQTALPALKIGLVLVYVALCGWLFPCSVVVTYYLLVRPHDSDAAGRPQRQCKRITHGRTRAEGASPPRRQPGIVASYVYSADHPWGWLVYRNGNFAGQELALKRAIASIGREEDNDVWLDDDTISRYHAELAWDKGQVYVTDNESLNGVLLNGRRIRSSMLVKAGDELEIGIYRFVMKYAPLPTAADAFSDPLLPQVRRIAASRNSSGGSAPGKSAPEEKRSLSPTVALQHSQGEEPPSFQGQTPQTEGEMDIARQDTAEFASGTPVLPPEEPGGLCIIRSGEMAGRSFLLDRPVLTIGSGPECDILLYNSSVARCHACFAHRAEGDYIQDLGSAQGTLVNGVPLRSSYLLRQEDMLTLGEVQMEYVLLPDAQTTPMSLSIPPSPFHLPLTLRLPSKIE